MSCGTVESKGQRSRSLFDLEEIHIAFPDRAISLEWLIRFQSFLAEIFILQRGCVMRNSWIKRSKVKVTVGLRRNSYYIPCPGHISGMLDGISNLFGRNIHLTERMCHEEQWRTKVRGQGHCWIYKKFILHSMSGPYLWNAWWDFKSIWQKYSSYREDVSWGTMTDKGQRSRSLLDLQEIHIAFSVLAISLYFIVELNNFFAEMMFILRQCVIIKI